MSLSITTLIEDTRGSDPRLENEHGISFFMEKDGHKILFDTGQTGAFVKNSSILGIDLSGLEYVVISHGHFDHSGGFRALTEVAEDFKLVVGEGFFTDKYRLKEGTHVFQGNSFNREFLDEKGINCQTVSGGFSEILPGVYVVTDFPRVHKDEVINPRRLLKIGNGYTRDLFTDEVLVAADTPFGLVVLLGCSHPGVKNMLDHVTNLFGRRIHAVFGGTHLIEADSRSLRLSIDYLAGSGIDMIGVSHCTGDIAMKEFKNPVFEGRFIHNTTGCSYTFREEDK